MPPDWFCARYGRLQGLPAALGYGARREWRRRVRGRLCQTMKPASSKGVATVVSFVDASTLAVRREAIERVKARGIFQAPNLEKR
jgi:hypothetical protein